MTNAVVTRVPFDWSIVRFQMLFPDAVLTVAIAEGCRDRETTGVSDQRRRDARFVQLFVASFQSDFDMSLPLLPFQGMSAFRLTNIALTTISTASRAQNDPGCRCAPSPNRCVIISSHCVGVNYRPRPLWSGPGVTSREGSGLDISRESGGSDVCGPAAEKAAGLTYACA